MKSFYSTKFCLLLMFQFCYVFFFIIIIFIGMLHYIILSNTTCYLHWIYSGYFYIEFTVVILSSWIVTSIYNANSFVCMFVLYVI